MVGYRDTRRDSFDDGWMNRYIDRKIDLPRESPQKNIFWPYQLDLLCAFAKSVNPDRVVFQFLLDYLGSFRCFF